MSRSCLLCVVSCIRSASVSHLRACACPHIQRNGHKHWRRLQRGHRKHRRASLDGPPELTWISWHRGRRQHSLQQSLHFRLPAGTAAIRTSERRMAEIALTVPGFYGKQSRVLFTCPPQQCMPRPGLMIEPKHESQAGSRVLGDACSISCRPRFICKQVDGYAPIGGYAPAPLHTSPLHTSPLVG